MGPVSAGMLAFCLITGRNAREFSKSQGGLEWAQPSINRNACNLFIFIRRNARELSKSQGGLEWAQPSINRHACNLFLFIGRNAHIYIYIYICVSITIIAWEASRFIFSVSGAVPLGTLKTLANIDQIRFGSLKTHANSDHIHF